MKTKIISVAFVMLMLSLTSGCAVYHHYGPFMGKVIDLETKEPIEGAAVLAIYYTAGFSVGGPVYHYTNARETLTDKNGEFRIPALNNFSFRPLAKHDDRVRFTIFKPEYGMFGGTGPYPGVLIDRKKPRNHFLPEKQYVVIEMPELQTKQERLENLRMVYVRNDVPKKKQRNILKFKKMERKYLGL